MLEIDKVTKLYKSGTFGGALKPALRQVSFDIDRGEVVSLIGESGSGKSTLGKVILRLVRMSGGRVTFEGVDVGALKLSELHDYYRNVQGVFQDPFTSYNPLYKADRVFEMVRQEYFGRATKAEWQAKLAKALETVSLNPDDVLNKFPHQLSGGQQQRLLVARALLLDVKLLIADEIISMLDASTRVDVLNMLVGLKRQGLGVLFITHDLSLGNYISDRTVILRYGAIVEMGVTRLVFGNPQHSYTRTLLTAVPQLHTKWGGHDVGAALDGAGGQFAEPVPSAVSSAGAAVGVVAEPTPGGKEPRRYSKSSLSPVVYSQNAAPQQDGDQPAGARPSLMDIPDQRWQRRVKPAKRKMSLDDYAPPPLVECEPGHFVAVEEQVQETRR
jgi:peptide/nickel transport system ATP-binding protein